MEHIGVSRREHVLLWLFALLDHHFGVALDLAVTYEKRFGSDLVSNTLMEEPLRQIRRGRVQRWFLRVKSWVPGCLKHAVKRLVRSRGLS